MEPAKNKLIIALDVDTVARARQLVAQLRDIAGMFKVGSQLFTAAGPDFVREIIGGGNKVFLDLKFHDIPNTVASAAIEATRLGVSIFNVHALGGSEMMERTAHAVAETASKEQLSKPAVIAVTLLTSANEATLGEIRIDAKPEELVTRLARMAARAGLDGVVASAAEASIIRSATTPDFLIVTPGVRPSGAAAADQKRIATPREAVERGADYVVVGRPILESPDPVKAATQIVEEINAVSSGSRKSSEYNL
ncbi:MAG TPA: orotidine-5'-phosphate decarboxylase [Pyrinomonadaceae bacterium]|nr:orotidine-5'-phosphate decarboxylase [Pyrinomonadaceae bacterium]